ncbi:hypothetical protein EYF80_011513 [Liparis tanakae]|uniref:Uncharacterized protein n=1 Tax=Liparis tanakae TaxID=230148 RepID=A0A4Z2IM99_9TELE|nr:hypothetical protein EYF80_011513 [Liparis tanakae]
MSSVHPVDGLALIGSENRNKSLVLEVIGHLPALALAPMPDVIVELPHVLPLQVLQRDRAEAALRCAGVPVGPPQPRALVTAAVSKAEPPPRPVEHERPPLVVRWDPSRPDAELPDQRLPAVVRLNDRLHGEGQGG